MQRSKSPTSFPNVFMSDLVDADESPHRTPSFTTAASLGLPDQLADHVAALTARTPDAASSLLAAWIPEHPAALFLLQFAMTDETWAAARAAVDSCKSLETAYLPFGVGMLGLSAIPRLVEAHGDRRISKHARFVYRMAIVAALAVEASRGGTWPAALDEYLRFDAEAWWFARTPYLFGNWHLDLQLDRFVGPLLEAAISRLPAARARKILLEALAIPIPKKFPMAFFALPCLGAHWRPGDFEKAAEAMRWFHTRGGGDGNERSKTVFLDQARQLGVFERLMIELYRTGHWNDARTLWFDDLDAFLAAAKRKLPAPAYKRLASDAAR